MFEPSDFTLFLLYSDHLIEDGLSEESSVLAQTLLDPDMQDFEINELADDLRFRHQWNFYYDNTKPIGKEAVANTEEVAANPPPKSGYFDNLSNMGDMATVGEFCDHWNRLSQEVTFQMFTNLRLCRKDIPPIWEHPSNVNGGKWCIYMTVDFENDSSIADQYIRKFLQLVIHLITGHLGYEDEIYSVQMSVRPYGLMISLWNADCTNEEQINDIKLLLLELLEVEEVKYYSHSSVLKHLKEVKEVKEKKEGGWRDVDNSRKSKKWNGYNKSRGGKTKGRGGYRNGNQKKKEKNGNRKETKAKTEEYKPPAEKPKLSLPPPPTNNPWDGKAASKLSDPKPTVETKTNKVKLTETESTKEVETDAVLMNSQKNALKYSGVDWADEDLWDNIDESSNDETTPPGLDQQGQTVNSDDKLDRKEEQQITSPEKTDEDIQQVEEKTKKKRKRGRKKKKKSVENNDNDEKDVIEIPPKEEKEQTIVSPDIIDTFQPEKKTKNRKKKSKKKKKEVPSEGIEGPKLSEAELFAQKLKYQLLIPATVLLVISLVALVYFSL
eukprot:TRINITY_DN1917_c0_g1_i1.p1 TRINITY_DN1917_c0_g1~~TRINITY_DN1917_c0_g1_i1.p1  ORF type:complete len:552 (+),score=154.76 TRINITY_DN1917_c0_g1_i1:438-2093(+)